MSLLQKIKPLASIILASGLVMSLSSCENMREVPMTPAIDANDPACAEVIIRLPDEVAGQKRRPTNAQSTGAWGSPVAVELVCGITPSGPTTDRCVSVNGIDWIVDPSGDPLYRFEAYGRNPGLEVYVNSDLISGTDAILDLASVVSHLPAERNCLAISDEIF